MKVIVVWNEIPEEVTFVVVETDDLATLRRFHNNYINAGDNDQIEEELNAYFYDGKGNFKFEKIKEPIFNKLFDLIVITGFVL